MITWTDDNMDRSSMWVKWALACPKKKSNEVYVMSKQITSVDG